MDRLRAEMRNSRVPEGGAAISTVTNPLPANIEELRRRGAEVHRLRAEITHCTGRKRSLGHFRRESTCWHLT